MLLVMAEADKRGYLLVNGRPPEPDEIAVLTSTDKELVGSRLAELERYGVFSRNRDGIIYSRRIVRDEKISKKGREYGKRGGNPTLCNGSGKSEGVKGRDNPQDKPPLKLSEEITLPTLTLPNLESESLNTDVVSSSVGPPPKADDDAVSELLAYVEPHGCNPASVRKLVAGWRARIPDERLANLVRVALADPNIRHPLQWIGSRVELAAQDMAKAAEPELSVADQIERKLAERAAHRAQLAAMEAQGNA
jgi:hypothetical protein